MAKKKTTAEKTESMKPKALSPFDILSMMFTDKMAFDKLSNLLLAKNFFMINRIMAINFPLQAQCFNQLCINQGEVVRAWASFAVAKCGYGRVPSFVYTRGAKKDSASSPDEIDKETKIEYCKKYNMSLKDFDDILYFNYDNAVAHIKFFAKMEDAKEQEKNVVEEKKHKKTKK